MMQKTGLIVFIAMFFTANSLLGQDPTGIREPQTPAELFEQRIMPIFRSSKPSSCVQCHLSSVDLKNYIQPSSEKTFVSLRDQGLIDLKQPAQSKILTLIKMGDDDRDRGARLIHEEMRKKELAAFSSWIVACCGDERLTNLPKAAAADLSRPDVPDAVIRHARKDRVLGSFVRNIWSQRLRCFPCHTPGDIKEGQVKLWDRYEDFEVQYGDRMNLFKKTPAETMKYWIERSQEKRPDELPLIDFENPANSLVLRKPTAKVPKRVDGKFQPPTYQEPISHMGGLKMHVNDQSYKAFVAWIKDYSNLKAGEYKTVGELPADNWFATKRVLRLKDAPDDWGVGTTVQLKVHRWLADAQKYSDEPVAFTQGTVTPRSMVNGALFLLAPIDPVQRKQWLQSRNKFRHGKHLVKIYVDSAKKIDKNPEFMLGEKELVGSIQIEDAQWQLGFPKAETVSANKIKRE